MKYSLNHSFIEKNRFIKRDLGVELEALAANADEFVSPEVKEEFHQFLRNTTYTLTKDVYHTKDDTSMKPSHSEITKILSYSQGIRIVA